MGGEWFASIGAAASPGTKVFALAGTMARTGLVEVPMGTPLRTIVYEMGGGVPGGYEFKAAQTGGPAGGCIPRSFWICPMDYESLTRIGSMMGSGGLIVMDNSSCMVDVARFFMEFCMDESCGKCIPCRAGTVQMHDILERMTRGKASENDLALLEQLCWLAAETSLCGLGGGAKSRGQHAAVFPRRSMKRTCRSAAVRRAIAKCRMPPGRRRHGMSVRTLEVDGRAITALEGQTIFDVAWDNGIRIPRLCHVGGLSDVGACRLCLVEIEGQKKLQASCLTKVAEDMVVRTDTPTG